MLEQADPRIKNKADRADYLNKIMFICDGRCINPNSTLQAIWHRPILVIDVEIRVSVTRNPNDELEFVQKDDQMAKEMMFQVYSHDALEQEATERFQKEPPKKQLTNLFGLLRTKKEPRRIALKHELRFHG